MSVCFIILNCFKYEHKRQQQRNTWLKDFPYELWFHIRGVPEQEPEFIVDRAEHIIYVKCRDDYESLTHKTVLALSAVRALFPSVTHIIKTDDDENCNVDLLVKSMPQILAHEYGGGCLAIKPHDMTSTYHYHSSVEKKPATVKKSYYFIGRFYFLSAAAADIVLAHRSDIWDLMYEDNAVGYALTTHIPHEQFKTFPDKQIFMEF